MTALVHLNGRVYAVSEAAVVESQILDALCAGGAFIDLIGTDEQTTRILVSPGAWVRIEQSPEPDMEPDGEEHPDLAYWDMDA